MTIVETMRAKRKSPYHHHLHHHYHRHNMHDILNVAKKYSPTLVKGYTAGNISVVDKKSWLEVCDRKHRYGANLRAYYKEWKRRPLKVSFWEWLDDESVQIEGIPRSKLERETVLYCATEAERQKFALSVRNGLIYHDATQEIVDSGEEGWIFVLRDGIVYGSQKVTEQIPRIHHTSFVGGECVQTAGMMVIENGQIRIIYPHSGHYRPSEHELLVLLRFLVEKGVDLSDVVVDVQRVQKVFRSSINGHFIKKIDNAHFWKAFHVLHFLEIKNFAWKLHLFDELIEKVHHHHTLQKTKEENQSILRSQCDVQDTTVEVVEYVGCEIFDDPLDFFQSIAYREQS
jgi:hypothetical protein